MPVKVDAVVWYRVVDPGKSVIEVQNVHEAVTQVALTLLRNLLGRHSLDDLLKEKDKLSEELRQQVTGLASYVQVRVDGQTMREERIAGKPAPDSFLRAAQLLDAAADQAAVFEDALAGVAAGRAGDFGIVVGVDRDDQAEELRRNGADVVVSDLAELLGS